jgi:quercetin dioxygenase-like cupin family protein
MIHIEPGEVHYVINESDGPIRMISTLAPYQDNDKVEVENYTYAK